MSVALDSSITLAWLYADETTDAVSHVLDMVIQTGAWVPAIWHLEVANGLEYGVRRGRNDRTHRDDSLSDLTLLNISIDPDTYVYAWTSMLALAERFGLTLYDASYLELAQRRGLPLASLDRDLRAAGKSLGIQLLGL